METVNILFGFSWFLSLVLAFAIGFAVAPMMIVKRQKMLIEAVSEAVKNVIDKVKAKNEI